MEQVSVRFGEFLFDPQARQLARSGLPVNLSPRTFDLLAALIAARPRVLSTAELHDRLWPGTAVGYTSLPRLVSELRRALGDKALRSRFVRTLHGRGYGFAAEAQEAPRPEAHPACSLSWNGQVFRLAEGDNFIGRAEDCLIQSRSSRVSRRHAVVRVSADGQAVVEDQTSRNGTFVDGQRIHQPWPLRDNDLVVVGPEVVTFLGPPPGGSTVEGDSGD